MRKAFVIGGIPSHNMTLYHRVQFLAGDPAALVLLEADTATYESHFIVRDIEADRARKTAKASYVYAPADLLPSGMSADREIATSQAIAELCRRHQVCSIVMERSTPVIYASQLEAEGFHVTCDPQWEAHGRRQKSPEEAAALHAAQKVTEDVMRRACETIGNATANRNGELTHEGTLLTADRVQMLIDIWLLEKGYVESNSIVAGGATGADCHDRGSGVLKTGEPIIVDIFPKSKQTLYFGDCTRTVVHGEIPPIVAQMHADVRLAKAAATEAVRAGVTGADVNAATMTVLQQKGYGIKPFTEADALDKISMTHGTGHGVGLAIHEAPLLVDGGPMLLSGDVITIEPGLYCRAVGGVRIEDMVLVTETGSVNFNELPEGLEWRTK